MALVERWRWMMVQEPPGAVGFPLLQSTCPSLLLRLPHRNRIRSHANAQRWHWSCPFYTVCQFIKGGIKWAWFVFLKRTPCCWWSGAWWTSFICFHEWHLLYKLARLVINLSLFPIWWHLFLWTCAYGFMEGSPVNEWYGQGHPRYYDIQMEEGGRMEGVNHGKIWEV